MRSRIKQNVKKQNLKTLLTIGAIIAFILIFGTQILIGFSVALDKLKGADEIVTGREGLDYIAPPTLNPIAKATKQDRIDIAGSTTTPRTKVELFVNNISQGDQISEEDNTFEFTDVTLDEGSNIIKAKVIEDQDNESDFSQALTIKFLNKEPTLELSMPQDGQTYKKDQSPIKISGKTDPGAKVTVNDFWAITNDEGEFYYMYPLKDGGNNLKIKSTDEAGNEKLIEININAE